MTVATWIVAADSWLTDREVLKQGMSALGLSLLAPRHVSQRPIVQKLRGLEEAHAGEGAGRMPLAR